MSRGLRGKLTSYGDNDFSLFLRRAFIKAAGYSDDALDRPIVGITNTHSDYNPCHGNVASLIEAAKRGVLLSGGLPMAFPTISIHESFASPTSMYLRNLMAMDTEEMLRAQPMDAVILIGGCDKTIPAQLMAAASADVPAIVLPTGPMSTGHHRGETLGACTDCRRQWSRFRGGEIDADEIDAINDQLVGSVGTCSVMGTASTMACLAEAMGLALPMTGSAPATSAERLRLAEATGRLAAAMAASGGPTIREIITPAAIRNAFVALQALGGSTNAVVHLAALLGRLGMGAGMAELAQAGDIPVIADIKPSGKFYMPQFHNAGGMPALLKRIESHLDLSAPTVTGLTIGGEIAGIEPIAQDGIRSLDNPVYPKGALAILSGNLAPRGAIVKRSAAAENLQVHKGRAIVFESVKDMTQRIDDPDFDVTADDVLVLRNAGPRGAPGMPEAGYIPIPAKLARRGVKDMVRLSDARMSGTAFGTVILHITPEAANGGPLAIVKTGDMIALDIPARRLELMIEEAEFTARMRDLPSPAPGPARGYARLYHDHVLEADEGADFDFLQADGR